MRERRVVNLERREGKMRREEKGRSKEGMMRRGGKGRRRGWKGC